MTTIKLKVLTEVREKRRKGGATYYGCTAVTSESKLAFLFLNEAICDRMECEKSYVFHNAKVWPKDGAKDVFVQVMADTNVMFW